MASTLYLMPFRPVYDSAGISVPGAQHYFTLAGSNTPSPVYSDSGLTTPLSNPVIADGAGKLPPVYMDEAISYRVRVYGREAEVGVDTPLEEYDPYDSNIVLPAADLTLRAELADDAGSSLVGYTPAAGLQALNLQTALRLGLPLMPEHFGAVGDGVTNDYTAYAAMVAAVNAAGGGRVLFGRGKTYYIGRYIGDGGAPALTAAASGMDFNGCNGLVIDGNGAKIDLKGNFDRSSAAIMGLPGMFLSNCSNVVVRNLEIDGNVEQMTNTSGAVEAAGPYGLKTRSCTGVTLENVYCHHMATDGFQIAALASTNGINKTASRQVTMINCRAEYSGRLAISLIQVRGFSAYNCRFNLSGQYGGTYGVHNPTMSLDIEPDNNTGSAAPNTMDINTGDILFDNCHFNDSKAGILSCILFASIDGVEFRSCQMRGTAGNTTAINLGVPRAKIEKCQIDAKDGTIKLGVVDPNTTIDFRRNIVSGNGLMLQANLATGRLRVCDNEFIGTYTAPYTGNVWQLSNVNLVLENNRVFIPKEAFVTGGAGDGHTLFSISSNLERMANNRFETDLTKTYLGATTAHFALSLTSTITAPVYDDVFAGTAPGTTDTFRPTANATAFDSNNKFNRRHRLATAPGSLAAGDAGLTYLWSQTPGTIVYDVPITANRTVTLSTGAGLIFKGARVRVIRTPAATGAFNVSVVGATTKAIAASASTQVAIFESLDGATWTLVDFTTF